MRRAGLEGRSRKRWRKTRIQDPAASAADLDLIQGDVDVGGELEVSYCGDITYTPGGWAHLATVIDISSRRVVGWALADHAQRLSATPSWWPSGVACHRRRDFPLRSRLSVRPRTAGTSPGTTARTNGAKPSLNRVRALPIRSWWMAAITNHRQARTGDRCCVPVREPLVEQSPAGRLPVRCRQALPTPTSCGHTKHVQSVGQRPCRFGRAAESAKHGRCLLLAGERRTWERCASPPKRSSVRSSPDPNPSEVPLGPATEQCPIWTSRMREVMSPFTAVFFAFGRVGRARQVGDVIQGSGNEQPDAHRQPVAGWVPA